MLILFLYLPILIGILTVEMREPIGLPGVLFVILGFFFFIKALINLFKFTKINSQTMIISLIVLISYPVSCSFNPAMEKNKEIQSSIQNDMKNLSVKLQNECNITKICKKIDAQFNGRYDVGKKTFFIVVSDNFDNFYVFKGGVNVPLLFIKQPENHITDFGFVNEVFKNNTWQELTKEDVKNFNNQYKIDKEYYHTNSKN